MRVPLTLTLLLFCLSVQFSIAQQGLHLGIRIMPQHTQLLNADDAAASAEDHSYTSTWGMAVGLSSMYAIDDNWSFGTNLLYSSQGHSYTNTYEGANGTETTTNNLRLRYVKMPFLAKWNTDGTQKLAFMVEGGIQPGLLMGADETRINRRPEPVGSPFITYNEYPERQDTYNNLQMWGVLGAGIEVKLRFNVKLNLTVRAEYGFLDAEDKSATYAETIQGVGSTQPFYSARRDRPSYTDNRPASNWLTVGTNLGLTYVFVPHFRP